MAPRDVSLLPLRSTYHDEAHPSHLLVPGFSKGLLLVPSWLTRQLLVFPVLTPSVSTHVLLAAYHSHTDCRREGCGCPPRRSHERQQRQRCCDMGTGDPAASLRMNEKSIPLPILPHGDASCELLACRFPTLPAVCWQRASQAEMVETTVAAIYYHSRCATPTSL